MVCFCFYGVFIYGLFLVISIFNFLILLGMLVFIFLVEVMIDKIILFIEYYRIYVKVLGGFWGWWWEGLGKMFYI